MKTTPTKHERLARHGGRIAKLQDRLEVVKERLGWAEEEAKKLAALVEARKRDAAIEECFETRLDSLLRILKARK